VTSRASSRTTVTGFLLADPVGPRGSLILDGGVPPGIQVDDGVRGGEVEPEAARLERDQEDVGLAVLEAGRASGR
jgi:hypothetical protein